MALTTRAYEAVRREAGIRPPSTLGRIVVAGKDRASYLQGLLTNDITSLSAGQGCYAAYLTPQGRMISDLHVYELGDVMLLTLPGAQKDTVLAKLDQFIFTEDVQLGDVSAAYATVGVVGPLASSFLGPVIGVDPGRLADLPEHGNVRVDLAGESVIVLRTSDAGVPGLDVLAPPAVAASIAQQLRAEGVVDVDPETTEVIRIEAGVPLFGRDMDEHTIPLEAGIEGRAISFTKGCYVGQEVVIRILHRGHGRVARKLVGLVFADERVEAAGGVIQAEGREVGSITSAAVSPATGRGIALGYVKRELAVAGTRLTTGSGLEADVSELPLVTSA
ncbi:MAG: folate-binding protein YgfZ [Vicinamibacterales bacterium]